MTDQELLAAIQEGKQEALALLYKSHFKMASHFVLNNSGNEDDAKDVYQEAVIVLYEKARANRLQLTCKISTYLYSVCRHLWLRRLALRNRYTGKVEDFQEFIRIEETEDERQNEENMNAMKISMGLLGDPCRTVVEAYYIHQQSMKQICQKMGYANEETAKNQKYKCLIRLKKIFFSLPQTNNA